MNKLGWHIAGPYRDLVQHCTRCGMVIVDNRNAAVPIEKNYRGGLVEGSVTDFGYAWCIGEHGGGEYPEGERCKPQALEKIE